MKTECVCLLEGLLISPTVNLFLPLFKTFWPRGWVGRTAWTPSKYQVVEPVVKLLDYSPHLEAPGLQCRLFFAVFILFEIKCKVVICWQGNCATLSSKPTSMPLIWLFSCLFHNVFCVRNHACSLYLTHISVFPIFVCVRKSLLQTALYSYFLCSLPQYELIFLFSLCLMLISSRFTDINSEVSVELDPGVLWSTCVFFSFSFTLCEYLYPGQCFLLPTFSFGLVLSLSISS